MQSEVPGAHLWQVRLATSVSQPRSWSWSLSLSQSPSCRLYQSWSLSYRSRSRSHLSYWSRSWSHHSWIGHSLDQHGTSPGRPSPPPRVCGRPGRRPGGPGRRRGWVATPLKISLSLCFFQFKSKSCVRFDLEEDKTLLEEVLRWQGGYRTVQQVAASPLAGLSHLSPCFSPLTWPLSPLTCHLTSPGASPATFHLSLCQR